MQWASVKSYCSAVLVFVTIMMMTLMMMVKMVKVVEVMLIMLLKSSCPGYY